MTLDPLVSVIIPTRNRSHFLARALVYISAQNYSNIEIIVVDDNSTFPVKIDQGLVKPSIRVKLIRNHVSIGANRSRKVGLSHASGDFICFHDDDDYWLNDKIFNQVHFLLENTMFVGVTCSALSQKKIITPKLFIDHYSLLIANTVGSFSLPMLRNFDDLHTHFNLDLDNAQDWWFWLSLYRSNLNIGVLPQRYPQVFFNEGNHSRISDRKDHSKYYKSYLIAASLNRDKFLIYFYHQCVAKYHTSSLKPIKIFAAFYIVLFRLIARILNK